MTMNIVLCTDDNYAMACGVCITSLLEKNRGIECNIYILTEGLSKDNVEKFKKLEKIYNQHVEILIINDSTLNGLIVSNRYSKLIYFRFLLPKLLSESKVLYLDCDIIVNRSLSDLWKIDINNYAGAVVEDQMGDDITLHNRIEIYNNIYFNSGVLMMNLDYWRKHNLVDKCIAFVIENPQKCRYPDQDALNFILYNKVLFLPYGYNFQEYFYNDKLTLFLLRDKWKEIDKWKDNPYIIHYTWVYKPWFHECTHPRKDLFIKYLRISPWKETKLRYYYPYWHRLKLQIINLLLKLRII